MANTGLDLACRCRRRLRLRRCYTTTLLCRRRLDRLPGHNLTKKGRLFATSQTEPSYPASYITRRRSRSFWRAVNNPTSRYRSVFFWTLTLGLWRAPAGALFFGCFRGASIGLRPAAIFSAALVFGSLSVTLAPVVGH